MRKTVILSVLIGSLVALAGLEMYRYAQMTDKDAVSADPAISSTEQTKRPRIDDCSLACGRLAICRDGRAGDECLEMCRSQWTVDIVECIQQAACDAIAPCMQIAQEITCEDTCLKIDSCELLWPEDDCFAECGSEWDQDFRLCLMETPCDEIMATCFPAIENDPCVSYCDRLMDCGLIEFGEEYTCIESCLAVDDPLLQDCAFQVTCEQIPAVCMDENYDPLCLDACDRLYQCGVMDELEYEECPLACFAQWDDNTMACIQESGCNEIMPVCFGRVDPVCEDVCIKLVDCMLEDYYEDCIVVCTTDLAEDVRSCIQAQACEQIESVCFGQQPDMCKLVCEKAVDCGVDADYQACYSACQEGYDLQLIGCVLSHPCEQITQQCLSQ